MIASTHKTLTKKLSNLRAAYRQKLPSRVQEIASLWQAFVQDEANENSLPPLYFLVHRLAGSGASFGMPEVSRVAATLESALRVRVEDNPGVTAAQGSHIEGLIGELRHIATQSEVERTDAPQVDFVGQRGTVPPPQATADTSPCNAAGPRIHCFANDSAPTTGSASCNALQAMNRRIAVLDTDQRHATELARRLKAYGYEASVLSSPDDIPWTRVPPVLIVERSLLGAVLPMRVLSGEIVPEHASDFTSGAERHAPLIVFSERDDLSARIEALRAGAVAFLSLPLDFDHLLDHLSEMTTDVATDPYRVLVVDDDTDLTEHYAAILAGAGMTVGTLNHPQELLRVMVDFHPDVILMDIYMNDYSGSDLARVIRQHEAWLTIPIVFLSSEGDADRQMAALCAAGDDFLTKPVRDTHLVLAVTSRAQRARQLHAMMSRDPLTGLLNHRTLLEHAHNEVARARRHDFVVSFAMIDLDFFKKVNDTHGHMAGDQTLRNLSHLLARRLRRTDIIGRYGGEEFSILLPHASGENARMVIDRIRADFERITQRAEEQEFHVTFSCGVSSLPPCDSLTTLIEHADQALYRAKDLGRNCVELF